MKITNFEFKAKVTNIRILEDKLLKLHPRFIGEDHQSDIYFEVPHGRLKLREGNIETALIYYEREDKSGARQSDVLLYKHQQCKALKKILTKLHSIKVIVDKIRRIYFIDNVKFHFDDVKDLGLFIEVEAIDDTGDIGIDELREQCMKYFGFFGIDENDCVKCSYSDLLLEKSTLAKV
jgi:predicted adenylyl cyclase CyaB